jgi:hypothetical protein
MPKNICVDFDGVLHSYTSGWKGEEVVADPPTPGAMQWLAELQRDEGLKVSIYSSRSKVEAGIFAMRGWLREHGREHGVDVDKLDFPTQKPAAFLTIDDRAICFNGTFPSLGEIHGFRTWSGK